MALPPASPQPTPQAAPKASPQFPTRRLAGPSRAVGAPRAVFGLAVVAILGVWACRDTTAPGTPPGSRSGTSPFPPPGTAPVGLVVHDLSARTVARLDSLGVRQVRYTLYWATWEADPAYRARFRSEVARADSAGLELLLVVHQDPWGAAAFRERDAVTAAFRDFLVARVREFPGRTWQLWNEMDAGFTATFGAYEPGLTQADRGRRYGEHLRIVAPAIRAADRSARIVLGPPGLEPAPFLEGVLSTPGVTTAMFDAVAIHCYGPPPSGKLRAWAPPTRAVLSAHGMSQPIWVTEFGLDDASQVRAWGVTDPARWDRYQLEAWQEMLAVNAAEHHAERLYGYALETGDAGGLTQGDTPGATPADTYGIIRQDGTWRAVARWLRATYGPVGPWERARSQPRIIEDNRGHPRTADDLPHRPTRAPAGARA